MSILNVNRIQPVGSGQTVTINAANISAGSATVTAGTFSGNVTATTIVGVSTAGITTAYIGSVNDGPISGARNRIINGDMRVDQRNAGASVSISGGTASYAADRFNLYVNTGTFALQRVSDAPTGFLYSDKVTVSSAGSSSSGVTNAVHFEQKIEGYNIDDLGVGTSNAKVVTLSFWVKSSVTGTYSLHFGNDTDRFYVTTYSISSANTWEYKTKTITLATSGTWNTTNGRGLEIVWSLLGGSTYQTSSTDQWISTEKFHVTGSVQFGENAAATWQITGVQLEAGTVATPFERRSFGQELALCQRYYQKSYNQSIVPGTTTSENMKTHYGSSDGSSNIVASIDFATWMRATPTITWYSQSGILGSWGYARSGASGANSMNTYRAGEGGTSGYTGVGAAFASCYFEGHWVASIEL
jgi:hypothetical protein